MKRLVTGRIPKRPFWISTAFIAFACVIDHPWIAIGALWALVLWAAQE